MKYTRGILALALAAVPLSAHHALAARYDLNQSVTVHGTVKKVEWANPHVKLFVDTESANPRDIMHWELEMASPNLLILNGLKIDSLRPGDHVTVSAYPARDGSYEGYARKVTQSGQ